MSTAGDYSDILEAVQQKVAAGVELESIIRFMRDSGLSKMRCMEALEDATELSRSEIKKLVHTSPTWADVREDHEGFHAELVDVFDEPDDRNG